MVQTIDDTISQPMLTETQESLVVLINLLISIIIIRGITTTIETRDLAPIGTVMMNTMVIRHLTYLVKRTGNITINELILTLITIKIIETTSQDLIGKCTR